MSAIWGCVDFSGETLPEGLCDAMQAPLERYKIDRFAARARGNALMGCGIQYLFAGSEAEPLPIWDEARGLLFTADCVLDNRAELAALLAPEAPGLPDGELLYRAWLRWGDACHGHLYGSYAFAAYDAGQNTLALATDYRATRCLYWARRGARIYFGTSLRSVAKAPAPAARVNLDWVADFLTLPFIMVGTDPQATPWDGVRRLPPATHLACAAGDERAAIHWQPQALPPLELEDDDAYRRQFLALMDTVAGDIAARGAPVGSYLSGGMDSSAVSAAAAAALARQGAPLHTYTSVPLASYPARRNRAIAEDESDEVRQLCAMYPNMRPRFCALEELDAFSILPDILDSHELPLKSAANLTWMYAIGEEAARDGCRVMLNGQLGNSTISYGDKYLELFRLIVSGRPLRALRVLNDTGKRLRYSRKQMLRILRDNCDFSRRPHQPPPSRDDLLGACYVDAAFAERQGSLARAAAWPGLRRGKPISRAYSRYTALTDPLAALVGEVNTKLGLARGFILRDLSADRRIIEFCCTAPDTCFMKDGVDRRMMRDYMAPLLPPAITQNVSQVGIQSADWVARLARRWPEIAALLAGAAEALAGRGYVDAARLRADLGRFPHGYTGQEDLQKLIPMCGVYALAYLLPTAAP